jgi:hypothetical protein
LAFDCRQNNHAEILLNKFGCTAHRGDYGHSFLFNVCQEIARMMLDQNENSEQLALIKMKYGFDKPIATSIYITSMTSPLFTT